MSDPLELVSGYLDHDLSDAELAELEEWILADPEHAAIFARRATIHSQIRDALAGEVSLRLSQIRSPELFEPIEGSNLDVNPHDMLNDAIIMKALIESDESDEPAPIELQPLQPPTEPAAARHRLFPRRRALLGGGSLAAMILLSLGMFLWHLSSRDAVKLTARIDAAWEDSDDAPALGKSVPMGKTLALTHGYTELTSDNGAKIVIQAPAKFIVDARDHLTLLRGRLTAQIPGPAHGFTVTTPAGEIVDLGTEFGVNVGLDNVVETQVFVGRIQVTSTATATGSTVMLSAGQAAQLADSGVSVNSTPAEPGRYVRNIDQVVTPFPTHSTGEGLSEGSQDPNWRITSVPNQPKWQPKRAAVSDGLKFYVPNDARSAWISIAPRLIDVDAGLYTFATTFELTGFDPSSAHLHLKIAADDNVAEARLNGHAIDTRKVGPSQWYRAMYPLDFDSGFVAGVNRLEIVVKNATLSKVALNAQLEGYALRNAEHR